MRLSRHWAIALLGYCVIGLLGCGYTTRSVVTEKFNTIHVSPFINKIDITDESYAGNRYRTYRPFVETEITQAVLDRFLSDGSLRPTSEELADLVLKGEFLEFRRDPLRYDKDDNVIEYRINLVVKLSLWDKRENKLLWEENHFTGDRTYFTSSSGFSSALTDDEAITGALSDLARRVVERVVEDW